MDDFEVKNKNTLGKKGQIISRTKIVYKCRQCNTEIEVLYDQNVSA